MCSASRRRARTPLESRARAILEGAGYERIETPTFESTELFARGRGRLQDIVRKEMFIFEDAGGRAMTLRPEGTAPSAAPTSNTACTSAASR